MSSAITRLEAYKDDTMKRIPLPEHAARELFFTTDEDDERVWMPIGDGILARPMLFNPVQGSWVTLIKADKPGIVSRHRHPAPVTGYTLEGAWGYLEHDWTATPGSFLFEPAGETHTLVVDPEVGHMKCLFHNFGPLIFVDAEGNQTGYDDVFTRLEKFKAHYEANGLGAEFATRLIR
ncbi:MULTISPECIES: 2,4'-dihydroxyacetophenone dioxygenase family protein [Thalassobaculum]|uniref:ChrR Cupin-like domain-containing protein n=1 Tax=Thalassobaculum litoreum DSM 18839 TaxID=1123362 RepID=A0A8G2BKU7_9PROT|nr:MULTISPECIES: 2,4'-dihydroxyacetophenone dioxygenase family protein [Thalassobaculum]SDG28826.1 ChrR Cupin-like domain-containing protein [Thalassobaculum litoreum DSM 18839]